MSGTPAYHGWTHRRKGQGGVDPVPFEISYCSASDLAVGQTVTADSEVVFATSNGVKTNDSDSFRFDTSDPSGVLIIQNGIYRMHASVGFVVGSIAAVREIYAAAELLSNGPLFGLGSPFGSSTSARLAEIGPNQDEASINRVTSGGIAKSQLYYVGVAPVFASPAAPIRAAIILDHLGTDYTLGNFASTLFIERLSGIGSAAVAPD